MRQIFGLLILLGAIGAAAPIAADEPVTVAVWPTIAVARGNAQLKIFIERNDANRTLTWEVDGPDYYRSSTTQLEGSAAPRSWFFFVHDLPEGEFDVRATVKRNNNSESMAMARIVVVSGGFR